MTAAQLDDVDRCTALSNSGSLETEALGTFHAASGKETPLHVPDFAFSYTAGGRVPALSFVV